MMNMIVRKMTITITMMAMVMKVTMKEKSCSMRMITSMTKNMKRT